jgi:hypothetical protein
MNYKLPLILFVFLLLGRVQANAQINLSCNENKEIKDLTSEDLTISSDITTITVELKGGDGGDIQLQGSICKNKKIAGGAGAKVAATFSVGEGVGQLKPGGKLRAFVGQQGQTYSISCISEDNHCGGGGGASALLYLPPGASYWHLLAVAGGGGGANRSLPGVTHDGKGGNAGEDGDTTGDALGGTDGSCGSSVKFSTWKSGWAGAGYACNAADNSQIGTSMTNLYNTGSPISIFLKSNSAATTTGGTGGADTNGGNGFAGGGAGDGGGGGGGGFSGGGGRSAFAGGGGGSYISAYHQPANTSKTDGSDGGSTQSNGWVKITTKGDETPKAVCQNHIVELDANGLASISADAVDNGSSAACGVAGISSRTLDKSSFGCSDVGPNTVTLTVTDTDGNSNTCSATVTVEDHVAPVASCPGTTFLDARNSARGSLANINSQRWQSFTAQNTGLLSRIDILARADSRVTTPVIIKVYEGEGTAGNLLFSTSRMTTFGTSDYSWVTLFSEEPIPVISGKKYTVSVQGQKGTVYWFISPSDNYYPEGISNTGNFTDFCFRTYVKVPHPITAQLDAAGAGAISLQEIDDGSTDACGIADRTLDRTSFDCSDVGPNTVTLTVTDNNGNSSSCSATVKVEDNVAPVASCPGTSLLDVENYSTSGLLNLNILHWQSFTAQHTGLLSRIEILARVYSKTVTTPVFINVYEGEGTQGNLLFSTAKVITFPPSDSWVALFSEEPIPVKSGSKYTVSVRGQNGSAYWFVSGYFNPYSGGRGDGNGLADYSFRTYVKVNPPITVQLDAAGAGSISLQEVDNGSTDACGIADLTLDRTSFDCTDVGGNAVTLTVSDKNGNSSNCSTFVMVEDNLAPVVTSNLLFLDCDDEENADLYEVERTVADNCDNDPQVLSVIAIPQMTDPAISFKVKKTKMLKFNVGENKIIVEAPGAGGAEAWWQHLETEGGVVVDHGQPLKLSEPEEPNMVVFKFDDTGALTEVFDYTLTLVSTATDFSGNTADHSFTTTRQCGSEANDLRLAPASGDLFTQRSEQAAGIAMKVFPNPFTSRMTVQYDLSDPGAVTLDVIDMTGRRVNRLLRENQEAGHQRIEWDGYDGIGRQLPAGIYIIRLQQGSEVWNKKVIRQ